MQIVLLGNELTILTDPHAARKTYDARLNHEKNDVDT